MCRAGGIDRMQLLRPHPGTHGRTLAAGELLLLAPMDDDADTALTRALDAGGFEFERRGPLMDLGYVDESLPALSALLTGRIPPALQSRVKGTMASAAEADADLSAALLRAEPLPVFFEQVEVAWARAALEDGWLFSVFQPIVEARTGSIFAYESLIRAQPPGTDDVIGAGQLIHACQRLNLYHQLDQRARVTAIRGAAALALGETRFFINFSPHAIYDPAVCLRGTMAAAEQHGVSMGQLVFEVQDLDQVESRERLCCVLDHYRGKGAGIALDHVDGSLSSLEYLAELLPDYVKIDRTLTSAAATSRGGRRRLEAVAELARRLGVRVVASGVEDFDQMHAAVECRADYLQGYLIARPASPPEPVRPEVLRLLLAA